MSQSLPGPHTISQSLDNTDGLSIMIDLISNLIGAILLFFFRKFWIKVNQSYRAQEQTTPAPLALPSHRLHWTLTSPLHHLNQRVMMMMGMAS